MCNKYTAGGAAPLRKAVDNFVELKIHKSQKSAFHLHAHSKYS